MRVLVAPDKFRGTLSASAAASAIGRGWQRGDPAAHVTLLPMADGGEGTLDVLVEALHGETVEVAVTGPFGEPLSAPFGLVVADGVRTGVVEMARASGLALVGRAHPDPKAATTRGTGELIVAAVHSGIERLLVTVGGSATNDGGAGMAQALGFRLLDADGRDLGPGGGELLRLARIDAAGADPATRGIDVIVATDVDNPLTGPEGASATYGPQKGATPADVDLLDRGLSRLAAIVRRDLGADVERLPGGGAAGGLAAGLVAFCGARLQRGATVVMDAVGFAAVLRNADLVVTGEGSFDAQSLRGKAPGAVLAAAREAGVQAIVLCGRSSAVPAGLRVVSLAERFGLGTAFGLPRESLETLAAEVAAETAGTSAGGGPEGGPAGPGRGGLMSKAIGRFEAAAAQTGLPLEILRFPEGTRTAADAARAIGCDVGQIVKSLVFVADGEPFLALTSGANRADTARLAALLGAQEVRRADADEVRAATGFAIGGTPPFGHPRALTVLIDRDLTAFDEVWAAAGTPDAVFRLSSADLVGASGGRVEDFAAR